MAKETIFAINAVAATLAEKLQKIFEKMGRTA